MQIANRKCLDELASRAGRPLDDAQHVQLDRYLDLLLAANERMNLTRIADRSAAEIGHLADALTLLEFLPPEPHRLADVGSGGGVPGIPLAIVRPDVRVLLIEATQKKAAFLRDTAAELGLPNVEVWPIRAEHAQKGGQVYFPGSKPDPLIALGFNVVTARALAPMDRLVAWCLPLVCKGGKLLAMKGPRIADELPAAQEKIASLGGTPPVLHPVALPGITGHVIVEIFRGRAVDARPRQV